MRSRRPTQGLPDSHSIMTREHPRRRTDGLVRKSPGSSVRKRGPSARGRSGETNVQRSCPQLRCLGASPFTRHRDPVSQGSPVVLSAVCHPAPAGEARRRAGSLAKAPRRTDGHVSLVSDVFTTPRNPAFERRPRRCLHFSLSVRARDGCMIRSFRTPSPGACFAWSRDARSSGKGRP